ncbi:MAG: M56 family metallopeptidase [Cellulosilyticaceae bacterium]
MMQQIFINIIEVSGATSIVILLVCMLSPIIEEKYIARWKYFAWLGIALRLAIPIPFSLPNAPIKIETIEVLQEPVIWHQASVTQAVAQSKVLQNDNIQIATPSNVSMLQIAYVIWIVGMILILAVMLMRYFNFTKGLKRWTLKADSHQQESFLKIKEALNVKHNITLHRCMSIKGPLMVGIIKPKVLIPCKSYGDTELYLILKHELVHYQRHDVIVKAFVFLIQSVYWFNPFIHIMAKQIHQEMEMCCDDRVVSGHDASLKQRYAETILECIRQQNSRGNLFTTNYSGGMKVVKKRFKNILSSNNKKKGAVAFTLFMTGCLGMSSLVAYGATATNAKQHAKQQVKQTVKQQPKQAEHKVVGIMAETKRDEKLEKTIIDQLQIPNEFLAQTKYYYNYVDLNNDGQKEIFVVVMGPYTSGTGGNTALYIEPTKDGMVVKQEFTLIQTPLIISDKTTNGYKDIIVQNIGGGASGNYVALTYKDGKYATVNEGTVVKNIKEVSGTAIIANDLIKDMENGTALYLQAK